MITINSKNTLLFLFFVVWLRANYASEEQQPNIFAAVNAHDIEAVRSIVESNQNAVHAQDCLRGTPLHWAAFHGHFGIVHYLIRKGAHVNSAEEDWHDTPLHYVVTQSPDKENIYRVLAFLIKAGSNVDAQSIRGHTPVHKAAMRCYLGYIKKLLQAGAYVDIRNKHGRTPLYRTLKEEPENWRESYRERCEVIKYFLEFGVQLETEAALLRERLARYAEYRYDFSLIIRERRQFWFTHFPALEEYFLGVDYERLKLPDALRKLLLDLIATPEL